MTFHFIRGISRSSLAAAAITLGSSLAACGGGGDDPTTTTANSHGLPDRQLVASAVPNLPVAVQGCVLDRHYIPISGTPVRVLSADGRLLGSALSDGQGRFTLNLPARSEVLLQVDRPQGESLQMRVNAQASIWEKCLLDEAAA